MTDWLTTTGVSSYKPKTNWHIKQWREIQKVICKHGRISVNECLDIIERYMEPGTNQSRYGSKKMIWYLVNQIGCLKYV